MPEDPPGRKSVSQTEELREKSSGGQRGGRLPDDPWGRQSVDKKEELRDSLALPEMQGEEATGILPRAEKERSGREVRCAGADLRDRHGAGFCADCSCEGLSPFRSVLVQGSLRWAGSSVPVTRSSLCMCGHGGGCSCQALILVLILRAADGHDRLILVLVLRAGDGFVPAMAGR